MSTTTERGQALDLTKAGAAAPKKKMKAEERSAARDALLADKPVPGQIEITLPAAEASAPEKAADNLPATVPAAATLAELPEYTPPAAVEITVKNTSYDFVSDEELERICKQLEAAYANYENAPPETRTLKGTEITFGEKSGFLFEAHPRNSSWNSHYVQLKYKGKEIDNVSLSFFAATEKTRGRYSFREAVERSLQLAFDNIPVFQKQRLAVYEKQIENALKLAGNSYIAVGLALRDIKQKNLLNDPRYQGDGALVNFWAFAEEKFGFKKSSVKNMIAVCERYCERDRERYLPEIKKDYKDYSYTQLVDVYRLESVYGEDIKTAKIKPSMSTRELKAAVDSFSPKKQSQALDSPKSSAPAELPPAPVIEAQTVAAGEFKAGVAATTFKNVAERQAFLDDYKSWPLWLDIPALQLKVFRAALSDGSTILTLEYKFTPWNYSGGKYVKGEEKDCHKFILCKKDDPVRFDAAFTADGYIVEHITSNKLSALLPSEGKVTYHS